MVGGYDVERHVREVAAVLGVADFVYAPTVVPKGAGTREVGDGILLCQQGGGVLQVKARDAVAATTDSTERAAGWLQKSVDTAVAQGRGTLRTIERAAVSGNPVRAVAVRALAYPSDRHAEFEVDLDDVTSWPIIVVLDHPKSRETVVTVPGGVFVVSLEDWRELNRCVRSVNGLLRYVRRVTWPASRVLRIGYERERFARVAAADQNARHAEGKGIPWFTLDGTHEDPGVQFYRELLEKIWGGSPRGPELTASDCRLILNFLDDVPVGMQASVGAWLCRKRAALDRTRLRQSGLVGFDDFLFVYACDTVENTSDGDSWKVELAALAATRLAAWQEQRATSVPAICVGVRDGFRSGAGVEYTHIYEAPDFAARLTPEVRQVVERRYGSPDLRSASSQIPPWTGIG